MLQNNRILLINDDQITSKFLVEKLSEKAGYAVSFGYSSQVGLNALKQNTFEVVIAKFGAADLDGTTLTKHLKQIEPYCIIIALVENEDPQLLKEISDLGVFGVVSKPINLERLFFLIEKGIQLRLLMVNHHKAIQGFHEQNNSLQKQNILLAKRIEESTKNLTLLYEDLRSTYLRTIKALAQAIDARDHYTHSHSENVAKYAVAIAAEMGLSSKEIETIAEACELHDLGKIGIEDNILSKPTSLTEEEWAQIKRHPLTAAQILEPLTFLNEVIDIVIQHHEHYDGSGYPEGRHGEDILLGARIIHLADAYEAMRSARPYRKKPFSKEEAVLEINRNCGVQFDPKVVEAFLRVVDRL